MPSSSKASEPEPQVFSLLLSCAPTWEDQLTAELWEAGTTGIIEEPGGVRAFFDAGADYRALIRRFAAYAPELRHEHAVDWAQISRDAWPPLLVGERFFLVPPWRDDSTPGGRLRLEMTPGMACGTGHHPATQLCLQAMEHFVRPGSTMLDVGVGSGILSAAAELLGASLVVGCDIDVDAVAIARQRVANPLFAGSVDAVRAAFADVIVANISSSTVEQLAPEFERVRKPDSVLILSGFPRWDHPAGYDPKETFFRDGWSCLIC
jgi:ribosomal protein L11 methyltransferase